MFLLLICVFAESVKRFVMKAQDKRNFNFKVIIVCIKTIGIV
jgi:hypothetical protein